MKKIQILVDESPRMTVSIPTEALGSFIQEYMKKVFGLDVGCSPIIMHLDFWILSPCEVNGIHVTPLQIPVPPSIHDKAVSFINDFVGWDLPLADFGTIHTIASCGCKVERSKCPTCGMLYSMKDTATAHLCVKCHRALDSQFKCPFCGERFKPDVIHPLPNGPCGQHFAYGAGVSQHPVNHRIIPKEEPYSNPAHKETPPGMRC